MHSAADALNYLRAQAELAPRNLPVLIVVDLDLPKSTSLAFLHALRQDSGLRNLPVLAMAWSEEEAAVRSLYGLGVSAYVIKPVRFADLLSVAGQPCWKWLPDSSSPALCYQSRVAQQ